MKNINIKSFWLVAMTTLLALSCYDGGTLDDRHTQETDSLGSQDTKRQTQDHDGDDSDDRDTQEQETDPLGGQDTESDTQEGEGDVTVAPNRHNDLLINPGMGVTDFHFGWWCNLPPISFTPEQCAGRVSSHWPVNHPDSAVAYFRWHWRDIEPIRGQINFDLIDNAVQSANLLGETLSFRVMTILDGAQGIPAWLTQAPYNVGGITNNDTFWPDYRDATYQAEHKRLIEALAARYDGHPAVDHVDIGTVGCWGEWNTACLSDVSGIFDVYSPQSEPEYQEIVRAYQGFVDDYTNAFTITPSVMLGLRSSDDYSRDVMVHAMQSGAGWRVDCWGDWAWGGYGSWSHMTTLYPSMIANVTAAYPEFTDVWKTAPVQLEVCATLPIWESYGWTTDEPGGNVHKSFQWALDQHASVLNLKSTDIPASYLPALEEMLKENGYRFVIDDFNHISTVSPGEQTTFVSNWSNIGVAPSYNTRALTYRLKGTAQDATFESNADIRHWLPGQHQVIDTVEIPASLPTGTYSLDVALLDEAGTAPVTSPLPPLYLGIEGRGADGWYTISEITVE